MEEHLLYDLYDILDEFGDRLKEVLTTFENSRTHDVLLEKITALNRSIVEEVEHEKQILEIAEMGNVIGDGAAY